MASYVVASAYHTHTHTHAHTWEDLLGAHVDPEHEDPCITSAQTPRLASVNKTLNKTCMCTCMAEREREREICLIITNKKLNKTIIKKYSYVRISPWMTFDGNPAAG